ncbi:MAG: PilZ domain-containing protein [Candidatus Omnitrophica bacterium]|nr:PilZ domain-containing protein [Candidatus Omnitrophota bacterium]MBU1870356.1 PilZ domain-containing protein [Candidatus Omnitrophota bacterium]
MWQGVDKRKFPRVNYPCEVTVYIKGQKENIPAQTENIGVGGVCVKLSKELSKFHSVDLAVELNDGKPPLTCEARVVWLVKSQDAFDTGMEFLNLTESDRLRIERVVEACLKANQNSSEKK